MNPLAYLTVFVVCVVLECIYVPVARALKIGTAGRGKNRPKNFTPAGGGIIFILAAFICGMFTDGLHNPFFFRIFAGATVLACVSFIDDIYNLPPGIRLLIQFAVVIGVFYEYLVSGHPDAFILTTLLVVGFMNSFNFMDGINGMLCVYGIVSLATLSYILHVLYLNPEYSAEPSVDTIILLKDLCLSLCIAVGAFALFNYRRKAIVFAGDIGSITLGFFIIVTLATIIHLTGDLSVLVLISVYVVDTSLTVIQRLFLGEHILTPHRHHVYQLLTTHFKLRHISVANIYALVQLGINAVYLAVPHALKGTVAIITTVLLIFIYFYIRLSPTVSRK